MVLPVSFFVFWLSNFFEGKNANVSGIGHLSVFLLVFESCNTNTLDLLYFLTVRTEWPRFLDEKRS